MTTGLIYKDEVYAIQGAVFEVYKTLGNGFTEEVYQLRLLSQGDRQALASQRYGMSVRRVRECL